MKILIAFLLSITLLTAVYSQQELPENLQTQFYKAYLSTNITLWDTGIKALEKEYEASPSEGLLLEIIKAQSGMVGSCFAEKDMDRAKLIVNDADKKADKLLKKQPDWATANALKAAFLGFKIAFSPMKGMWLGPKSGRHIAKSIKLDEKSPEGWYQKGMSAFQTPPAFGGDLKEAIDCFEKAVSLYEQNQGCLDYNWNYLDAMAWLGQAQTKAEDYAGAKATYAKALDFEPDFQWVKRVLMPGLEKEIVKTK